MRGVSDLFRVVVLASGNGTNLQALLDGFEESEEVAIVGVGSDKPEAKALERASVAGVESSTFLIDDFADRPARDGAMADWIESIRADLVVLAGYMQLLSPAFIARFRNRIINVHPALLPSFPGLDAVGQALDAGVRITGVTVHFVDEGVDSGPVIIQRPLPVPPNRDRAELEETIHKTEHSLLPQAVTLIAEGRVRIDERNPRLVVINE